MDERWTQELDRRFDQTHRQIEEKFADTHSRIDDNSRRIEENGRRIDENGRRIEENGRRIDENSCRIDALRVEMIERFDKADQRADRMEAQIRHTNVVVEDLRSDVQLLAEGFSAMDHKVDRILDAVETGRERHDQLELRVRRLEAAQSKVAAGSR